MSASLPITYRGATRSAIASTVLLEQEAAPSAQLTLTDMQNMLSLAANGIPAAVYHVPNCPAALTSAGIKVELAVLAWPTALDLRYQLRPALGRITSAVRFEQEREFDLLIAFAEVTQLPFLTTALTLEWSELPCFNRYGEIIDRPELTVQPGAILSSGDFLGVIRVRCTAIGYRHVISLTLPKTGLNAITDIQEIVTAVWDDNGATRSTTLDLELPGCAASLLATCYDGELAATKYLLNFGDLDGDLVPVVYYNDCNGAILGVRYE